MIGNGALAVPGAPVLRNLLPVDHRLAPRGRAHSMARWPAAQCQDWRVQRFTVVLVQVIPYQLARDLGRSFVGGVT